MRFSEIMGHESEKAVLTRAIAADRVPHAYIFAGKNGIGKSMLARAFAAALNCETSDSEGFVDSCGECSSCVAMRDGSHVNLTTIAPDGGYLKIERVRELQRALRLKAGAGYKVAIVEGADMMAASPANALLKTLEEPPPRSVIILVTSRPSLLLPTILSRARRLSFKPLSTELIAASLKEELALGDDEAWQVASLSLGSLAAARDGAKDRLYEQRLERAAIVARSATSWNSDAFAFAGELARDDDLDMTLEYLKLFVRDAAACGEGARELAVTGSGGEDGLFYGLSTSVLVGLYGDVERAQVSIKPPRNANKQLMMEVLLARLAAASGARESEPKSSRI